MDHGRYDTFISHRTLCLSRKQSSGLNRSAGYDGNNMVVWISTAQGMLWVKLFLHLAARQNGSYCDHSSKQTYPEEVICWKINLKTWSKLNVKICLINNLSGEKSLSMMSNQMKNSNYRMLTFVTFTSSSQYSF